MDHVAGFDSFFRCLYNRTSKPNRIWGPPGTAEILQHRFRGYWWNLVADQTANWHVTDIHVSHTENHRFELADAFSTCDVGHPEEWNQQIYGNDEYTIHAIQLRHHGTTIGYRVNELPRTNINIAKVKTIGLAPGPWMQSLKDFSQIGTLEIDGKTWSLDHLRDELLVETAGDSIAYLTDFLLDTPTIAQLVPWLSGCQTVVCESQYRQEDGDLAEQNHHSTTAQVSSLAAAAGIGELVLFHLSDRYARSEWLEMLDQCRLNFANTRFPDHWKMS
jgi:ribonuclease Z